ncbi:hypothetical protein ACE6H2_004626 [Prunus campanulata]
MLTGSVIWTKKHQDAFKRLGIRSPTRFLMFGPPRFGKILMARAVASEARLTPCRGGYRTFGQMGW